MVDTVTWNEDTGAWGDAAAIFSKSKPVQIIGNNFYVVDEGIDFAGAPVSTEISVVLSRDGLTVFGKDQQGNPKNDPTMIKNVQGIWPEINAVAGTSVDVYVGFQDQISDPITWIGPRAFIVGTDDYLDMIVTGRYISVRFESYGQPRWVLSAYDLEVEPAGNR